jgi:cytochrome c peroxidase
MSRTRTLLLAAGAAGLVMVTFGVAWAAGSLSPNEQLGKAIFFDANLSLNENQSCASCHGPEVGFTGPLSATNLHGAVYEGSVDDAFGDRKPPSSAYTTMSPILHLDKTGTWVGGNFWNGRATGEKLGNPAADQAQGPFLNPAEQALATPADVVTRVCASSYGGLFRQVWGAEACDPSNVDMAYDSIALSIAAYEASAEVNTFSLSTTPTRSSRAREEAALFKGKGAARLAIPRPARRRCSRTSRSTTSASLGIPRTRSTTTTRPSSTRASAGS